MWRGLEHAVELLRMLRLEGVELHQSLKPMQNCIIWRGISLFNLQKSVSRAWIQILQISAPAEIFEITQISKCVPKT